MGSFFKNYISTLSDYELLILSIYRMEEISSENKDILTNELLAKKISNQDFKRLKKEYVLNNKNRSKCPRCHSIRIREENQNDKIIGIPAMSVAYKYAPESLKANYTCEICGKKFSKFPGVIELWQRLWQ